MRFDCIFGDSVENVRRPIMLRRLYAVILGGWVACLTVGASASDSVEGRGSVPVDIVICLDTSGSMSDLIDSARGRIWNLVTELAKAKPTPRLRVGLLSYGTPETSTAEQGWVVRQIDLTDDLDALYAKLMALTTNGGDEFVGWVLSDAVETMSWSSDERALRLIYVAGNESADQGADQRNFRYVAEKARGLNIIINPIYAGGREQGILELWDQVAQHAGGDYVSIDVKEGTRQIATPYDIELLILNQELNATYIPYGSKGAEGIANQIAQDTNAGNLGAQSCGSRVAAKGCSLYNNAAWDLVDAVRGEGFSLTELKPEELPESLRSLTPEERKSYVEGMRAVRTAVQARIQETNTKRELLIRAERIQDGSRELSLDDAMIQSLRTQAEAAKFTFPPRPTATPVEVVSSKSGSSAPLPQPFQANLDALIASLPTVKYRVGSYETRHQEFATPLVEHTGQAVSYAVEQETFASKPPAEERLIVRLLHHAKELQTIQEVQLNDSPFVYTKNGAAAPTATVRYRLGGLEFPDQARAEMALKRIGEEISKLEGTPQESSPIATAQFLRQKIRVIAETSAQVFRQTGC